MKNASVRVRRDRPSGLALALAFLVTMLAFYIISLSGASPRNATTTKALPTIGSEERVTGEITFDEIQAYFIQFGAFEDAENARIEAARYTSRGAAGYIAHTDDGMYRVLASEYATGPEAERVKTRLMENDSIDAAIYTMSARALSMKVTGTKEQIDALKNADKCIRTSLRKLSDISFQIDRDEIDDVRARSLIAIERSSVENTLSRLIAASGESPNDVSAGLIDILGGFSVSLSELSVKNSESALSLSARIKYNNIEIQLREITYQEKLNG